MRGRGAVIVDQCRAVAGLRCAMRAARGKLLRPAMEGGQRLRLGPGRQKAVVRRMQKAFSGDPAFLPPQLGVQEGYLPGGPAETDEAQLEPETQGLRKTHRRGGEDRDGLRAIAHAARPLTIMVSGFQLCVSACAPWHQAYSASYSGRAACSMAWSSSCRRDKPSDKASKPA